MDEKIEEIPEFILKSVQKIIQKENFNTFEVTTNKMVCSDNNFLGDLFESEIKGETDDGDKKLNIFFKYIIKNENFTLCSLHEVYRKEVFVYLELLKLFEKFQEEAKVPVEDRFNMVKCYEETNTECIILENLAVKGYKTLPFDEVMSLEFTEEGVRQLAKFHALSFVLEEKLPDFYEENVKTVKASLQYNDCWTKFVDKISSSAVAKFDGDIRRRLDRFLEMSLEKYPKYVTGQTSNLKCLCHGDYKMNNILHKKENGRITHLVPIDYQHVYYGCPVIDFYFFIYAGTDTTFRAKHLTNLRALYCETLTNFLQHFGIDFDSIFSKAEFEKCFDDSREYALMFSLYILPLFYVAGEPLSAKDNLLEITFKLQDKYYERITKIVEEFVNLNIL
ncbi:uncharacterized protein LOC121738596 [Aricia agestis]|uniref:uncharacterized protein LOC121738596 n=1 Tax=Aricia agestis TaxID=91739 RepID=UPI001C205F36|nr:uncharacterized protein LOC121738596 [Aricia agestis]